MTAELTDVMRLLARIEATGEATAEKVDRFGADFRDEKISAQASRSGIHHRLDEQGRQISRLETTLAVTGEVNAQLRDRIAALEGEAKALATLNHRLAGVEQRLDAATPTLREYTEFRLRAEGAGWMGKKLWWIGGGVIAAAAWLYAAWDRVLEILRWIFKAG